MLFLVAKTINLAMYYTFPLGSFSPFVGMIIPLLGVLLILIYSIHYTAACKRRIQKINRILLLYTEANTSLYEIALECQKLGPIYSQYLFIEKSLYLELGINPFLAEREVSQVEERKTDPLLL